MSDSVWAEPREVTSLDDCQFYHTMDLPGLGTVKGAWDLRGRETAYLGSVDVRGHSVLEVGTASGHLCFAMEKMGAEVVAYDLSEEQEWDIVPYDGYNYSAHIAERKVHMRLINNGWWAARKAFDSQARVVYGTVYDIPEGIGQFDIGTLGSILLHLRDPFLALQSVSAHIEQTMIVTDVVLPSPQSRILAGMKVMEFAPVAAECEPSETWWRLTPELVSEFLQVLGFVDTTISLHSSPYDGREVSLYTVVGHRKGAVAPKAEGSTDTAAVAAAQRSEKARLEQEQAMLESVPFTHVAKHLVSRGFAKLLPKK